MANQQGNGRNVAVPDENPSWRPRDDEGARSRRSTNEDEDRYMRERNYGYPSHMEERAREREYDERYAQGRGGRWDERERMRGGGGYGRGGYEGPGGGGYGHGAYEGMSGGGYLGQGGQMMGREMWGNEGYARGTSWGDQGGYGASGQWRGEWRRVGRGRDEDWRGRDEDWRGRDWQGGQPEGMREYGQGRYGQPAMQYGGRGAWGHGGLYGQGGYNEGMYGRGGMQDRYGSQGYQGWGQEPGRTSYRGKGPAGYVRSDERIREMVCEVLTEHDQIDATNIEVAVKNGEVTLSGTVEDRRQKRLAEDVVEQVSGVKDVQNQIRISAERKSMSPGKDEPSTMAAEKRGRA